jgi:hypothetical protein
VLGPAVQYIFNASLSSGKFPVSFKLANIQAIPKSGSQEYRPISLLSHLSKALEHAVLMYWLKPTVCQMLRNNQFAFTCKSGTGTQTALTLLNHIILENHDKTGSTTRVLAIDFQKAFDRAAYQHILAALANLGAPYECFNWMKSFLCGRQQRVALNEECVSGWETVRSGIPQGSVLGPLLFAALIDSLQPVSPNTRCIKYADDVTFLHLIPKEASDELSTEWRMIQKWSSDHLLTINCGKTKLMTVNFSSSHSSKPLCELHSEDGTRIEEVTSMKLLGLHVDCSLKWKTHVDYAVAKATKNVHVIRQMRQCGLPPNVLWNIYSALIRSHLTYASTVTLNMQKCLLEKIGLVERRVKRIIGEPPPLTIESFVINISNKLAADIRRSDIHPLREMFCQRSASVTRNAQLFYPPFAKTARFKNSFIRFASDPSLLF